MPPQEAGDSERDTTLTVYRPSAVPNQNSIEARCFQYFAEKTVAQLTYFFPDDLWNVTVLQIAQSNPSVRHAISSLSWYHERFVRPTTDLGDKASFALVQYNLAIKHVLVNQVPCQPVHVGIISCLLFVCIESLRGNLNTAMHLFKYGRYMIQDARRSIIAGTSNWDTFGSGEFLQAVEAIFLPLGIQISLLVGDVDPDFSPQNSQASGTAKYFSKSPYSNLREARDDILQATQEYLAFDKINGDVDGYLHRLGLWRDRFREYIQRDARSLEDQTSQRSIALLDLQAMFLEYSVSCFWPSDPLNPMRWDKYSDNKIEEMIGLAATAVGLGVSGETMDHGYCVAEPRFQLDLGVVPILWNIIDRCRTPHLRRYALRILQSTAVQEGVWNAALVSIVAERGILLEEAGLERVKSKEDIPKAQRPVII
ncbi:hypothetical protein PFICI_03262 [Pestalotiopsis fici W106-1]|uniref:Uncharacterized protein n=1 Tax=Pestalotiopsis fici (strain W106-1 / CGMCC3.15140) TaxID=1229662 RepID=W3XIJ2_PESFW|nr:uncharacterized protein PFICI_03262 [Pestalotiopsis fici W106-1]ETS85237.1 hypothetical protein PFICI_03262 [Pestalotiopsis fici W106-1]